jgi:hypothetical protein
MRANLTQQGHAAEAAFLEATTLADSILPAARQTLDQVEDIVKHEIKGNFFTLDLGVARAGFEKLPWVRKAQARKRVEIGEELAFANGHERRRGTSIHRHDGRAYLVHSVLGAGPLILHRMSPDGRALLDDETPPPPHARLSRTRLLRVLAIGLGFDRQPDLVLDHLTG